MIKLKQLESLFKKRKVIRFLVVYSIGVLFALGFIYISKYKLIANFALPFYLPTFYLANVFLSYPHFQLLSLSLLRSPPPIIFLFLHGFVSCTIFFLIRLKNTKKPLLYSLFVFYMILLSTKIYSMFILFNNATFGVAIGGGNLEVLIQDFSIFVLSIIILKNINKVFNFKFVVKIFLDYFFLAIDILLTLFISNIFLKYSLQGGAKPLDKISINIDILVLGLFVFIIVEIIRRVIYKKLVHISQTTTFKS